MVFLAACHAGPGDAGVPFWRKIGKVVIDQRFFAQKFHHLFPQLAVPAILAVGEVGKNMRAFVQQGRVPVRFATGFKQGKIQGDFSKGCVGGACLHL